MKKILLSSFLLLLFLGARAQIIEVPDSLSVRGQSGYFCLSALCVDGWLDENTYQEKSGFRTHHYKAVDLRTGKKTDLPNQKDPIIPIALENGNIVYYSEDGNSKQLTHMGLDKNPQLSPNGQYVAFTRNQDLYTLEIATGKETRLTADAGNGILNGYASWIYYEEILGRSSNYCAFWWSPDSQKLVFFRTDESEVPEFSLYNAEGHRGSFEHNKYPKAGDTNPKVKIGVVAVTGGPVVWADFDSNADQYMGIPFWSPQGTLYVQWMNRDQNNLKLFEVNLTSGQKTERLDENRPTWVEWIEAMTFLKDGFIVCRDTDGWQQLYYYGYDGSLKTKLTQGKLWNTQVLKMDEKGKRVFFLSNGESPVRTDLYVVDLTGKNQKRLTFGDYHFEHILLSPNFTKFAATYSNLQTPPVKVIVDIKTGEVKTLHDSKTADFERYNIRRPELVWLTTSDGFKIPGHITYPINLDSTQKYPVLISVYGGPNMGSVKDQWKDTRKFLPLSKAGIIQITIDHRGSGYNGRAGLDPLYRNLGKWEMNDYIEWVKWLRTLPFVDSTKICINGGSYGGYISAMAGIKYGNYFPYAMADYAVMDWSLYDSHYTERYMGRPVDNPEGYKNASVLTYVDQYRGGKDRMLRIVHGDMDDNVHIQNSIQLVQKLQDRYQEFQMIYYPGQRHGWGGPAGRHKLNEDNRFIFKYLKGTEVPAYLR